MKFKANSRLRVGFFALPCGCFRQICPRAFGIEMRFEPSMFGFVSVCTVSEQIGCSAVLVFIICTLTDTNTESRLYSDRANGNHGRVGRSSGRCSGKFLRMLP